MSTFNRYLIVFLAFIITAGGAYAYYSYTRAHSSLSDDAQVRMTVSSFGDELKMVPLLAPGDLVGKAMDMYYSMYVHPDLLAKWKADPLNAPGRLTSSPAPDRIDVTKTTKNEDGTYTIEANVVETSSGPDNALRENPIPVVFTLTLGPDGWQITGYQKL